MDQVTVVGGSSYIGQHLLSQLLDLGYKVNATTRSAETLGFLKEKFPETLKVFSANILTKDSLLDALEGSVAVFHLAAPVLIQVKDAYEEQIRPAVEGTHNLLDACLKTPSIKTIIATSSTCAIHSRFPNQGYTYSEKDFHTINLEQDYPYIQAKVQAEKCVWDFNQKHASKFRVIVINPSFVFGPELLGHAKSTSLDNPRSNLGRNLLATYLKGECKEIPQGGLNTVDVRDVARAHILALQTPKADGRFIVTAGHSEWKDIVKILSSHVKHVNLPTSVEAKDSGEWRPTLIDNSKSIKVLGMDYRPIETSLADIIAQLKEFQPSS